MKPEEEVLMENLTWKAIHEKMKNGVDTVIITVGATEQHGPVLPLKADTANGLCNCIQIALKLGNTLVAPAIQTGCSNHHMAFKGTVSLRDETLKNLIVDYVHSLVKHGFKCIVIYCAHGGNKAVITNAVETLREEAQLANVTLIPLINLSLYNPEDLPQVSAHGGWREISHFLYTCSRLGLPSELARIREAQQTALPAIPSGIKDVSVLYVTKPLAEIAPDGNWHTRGPNRPPTEANLEFGRKFSEGTVANIVEEIRAVLNIQRQ